MEVGKLVPLLVQQGSAPYTGTHIRPALEVAKLLDIPSHIGRLLLLGLQGVGVGVQVAAEQVACGGLVPAEVDEVGHVPVAVRRGPHAVGLAGLVSGVTAGRGLDGRGGLLGSLRRCGLLLGGRAVQLRLHPRRGDDGVGLGGRFRGGRVRRLGLCPLRDRGILRRLGGGAGGEGHGGAQHQDGGQGQSGRRLLFQFHNKSHSLFHNSVAEGAAQGQQAAAPLLPLQKGEGVFGPGLQAAGADDGFITAPLQIPVGAHVHAPHQGVEPVDAQGGGQKQLPPGVPVPDVGPLVEEDIAQFLCVVTVQPLGQQDHRPDQAVGQRRADAVAPADRDPAQNGVTLPPPVDGRMGQGQSGAENGHISSIRDRKGQGQQARSRSP